MTGGEATIVIKKVKKVTGGGHHGGAWKVAYADFVTAMMAFFLLMWLINTTSPQQKRGIADYFAPASVSASTSGSGGILGGTALGEDGVQQEGSQSVAPQTSPEQAAREEPVEGESAEGASEAAEDALARQESADFQSAAVSLRQALQDMPELAELSRHVLIDQTPEGLRIQLVDQEGRSMFDGGSARPNERARVLLRAVAQVVQPLPNQLSISGHTSAEAAGHGSDADWALSAARADGARQVLMGAGVDRDRVRQVSGKANAEPLFADDPTLPGNRRISIVLLRTAPVLPADHSL